MDKSEPNDQQGTVIHPSNAPPEPTVQAQSPPPEVAPQQPEPAQQAQPLPDNTPEAENPQLDLSTSLNWTAPEFADSEKSPTWYLALLIAAAAIAGVLYLLTKDIVTVSVVVVAAIILSILASHKPKEVEYRLDQQGIGIGPKTFTYGDFRSFSATPEGNLMSVILMPLRRFATPASIYFAQADQEKILNMLSERLPFERHRPDLIDRVLRSLHI
jgi:hypothetical protein